MDRRKRSNRKVKNPPPTDQMAKDYHVYEYHESSRTKSKKPKHKTRAGTRTTTHAWKYLSGDSNRTVPRQRENIFIRRPQVTHPEVMSEIDDLANDDYFYEHLKNGQPPTESSAEVEQIHPKQIPANREVVPVHGQVNRGKQRYANRSKIRIKVAPVKDEDTYDDYGFMELDDANEEMQSSREDEEHVKTAQVILKKPCGRRNCNSKKRKQSVSHVTEILKIQPTQEPIENRPKQKSKKSERLVVTKRLSTPEELHAEIDKIFESKKKNYDKHGHDKSHWELRIVPKRYEDYEDDDAEQ